MPNRKTSVSVETILVIAGLLFIFFSMLLGFVYASWISHVANADIKQSWLDMLVAVSQPDINLIEEKFLQIQEMSSKRGRIMSAHSHLGACGLAALLLAIVQPLSSLKPEIKKFTLWIYLLGAILQFIGILSSHFYNPGYIYLSEVGALMLAIGVGGTLYGIVVNKKINQEGDFKNCVLNALHSRNCRMLVIAGTGLILLCMLLGMYLAWLLVSDYEDRVSGQVENSVVRILNGDLEGAQKAVLEYNSLQGKMAINAASHSHGIMMSMLMLLLALLRSKLNMAESKFRIWCFAFIGLSYVFPLWVFLAINFNFFFAKFANYTGLSLSILLLIVICSTLKPMKLSSEA